MPQKALGCRRRTASRLNVSPADTVEGDRTPKVTRHETTDGAAIVNRPGAKGGPITLQEIGHLTCGGSFAACFCRVRSRKTRSAVLILTASTVGATRWDADLGDHKAYVPFLGFATPPVSAEGAMKIEWRTHSQASSAVEELIAAQESRTAGQRRKQESRRRAPLAPNCLHLEDRQAVRSRQMEAKRFLVRIGFCPAGQDTSRYHDAAECVREASDKVVCHKLCHRNYGNVCQMVNGRDKESTWPAHILASPALHAISHDIRPMGSMVLTQTST